MGLFSDKITTVVSSSVYNLAGDENSQPDQLKSAIIGNVLSGRDDLAQSITNTYVQGTVLSQRRFLKHMTDNNPTYLIDGAVNSYVDVSAQAIKTPLEQALGLTGSETLRIAAAKIDVGEIDYWAEDWVQKNHPDIDRDAWFSEYDDGTDEIIIELPEDVTVRIAAPADFLWATAAQTGTEARKLLYVAYTVIDPGLSTEEASESLLDLFVYRMGSGNVAFDGLQNSHQAMTEFYPALPLRLKNRSIRHADYTSEYAVSKTAYRRLTRQKLDDLLDVIEENDDIGDIDYTFLVHGVCLNTKNQVAKEYLYKFLSQLKDTQTYSKADYELYQQRVLEAEQSRLDWQRYVNRQNSGEYFWPEDPPVVIQETATIPPVNTFEFSAPALENLQQRLSWRFMEETQQYGNCNRFDGDANRTKAKQGEYYIHKGPDYTFKSRVWQGTQGDDSNEGNYVWRDIRLPRTYFFHQTGPFTYTRLEIAGFLHENFVYKSTSVDIKAEDALEDADPSGFIIPLHAPTLSGMGMSKATRLSGSTSHLVFNSYERVRQPWYERGIFRILLVIAAAALSVVIPGLGGITASGILGSNLAVGAALGLTTVVGAAIAGAVANALVAVLVTTIISTTATELFGEKIGVLIASIASLVAMTYTSAFAQTGSFNVDWGQLFSADNLLKLTNSVGDAYSKFLSADTMEIYSEFGELENSYNEELEKIEDLMAANLGQTNVEINPLEFTDASLDFGESRETYLSRTLLTGSDVVKISHNMVSNFSEISLSLPKAFV